MWALLAQTPEAPWLTLLNYGVLGFALLAVLFGLLFGKPSVDRIEKSANERVAAAEKAADARVADAVRRAEAAEARADSADEELARQRATFEQQFIPALVRSTDVIARIVDRSVRDLGAHDG